MKTRVLFFGATADAAGTREIEMDFADETAAGDAFRQIVARFPPLEKHALLFAVNQEYATGAETVRAGDELAVFTHVSGG